MNIKVIRNEPNHLEVEVEGEDHTLCNALRKVLLQDRNVKFAAYRIDHPLTSSPVLIVKTIGKMTPLQAVVNSASKVAETADDFAESFRAALEKAKK